MKMNFLKRSALFFITGAIGYGAIEILWRGHTHPTMMLAGGICFLAFSFIAKSLVRLPLIVKSLIAAFTVTFVELVFGLIFNVWLKMAIWDYSAIPFNFLGQICPLFSLCWCGLALIFIPLAAKMSKIFA